jgi:hypothetical protein
MHEIVRFKCPDIISQMTKSSLLTALAVIGMFFVVSGFYEQKVLHALQTRRVEYRFIPRSTYEEQMDTTHVSTMNRAMFDATPLIAGGRAL